MFPNGLPDVDPNRPADSDRRLKEALTAARPPATPQGDVAKAATPRPRRCPEEPKGHGGHGNKKNSFAKLESPSSQLSEPRAMLFTPSPEAIWATKTPACCPACPIRARISSDSNARASRARLGENRRAKLGCLEASKSRNYLQTLRFIYRFI